jgi:hypothetical protein
MVDCCIRIFSADVPSTMGVALTLTRRCLLNHFQQNDHQHRVCYHIFMHGHYDHHDSILSSSHG